MTSLRKLFPDSEYPDEANPELDYIPKEEVKRRMELYTTEYLLGKIEGNGAVVRGAQLPLNLRPQIGNLLAPSSSTSVLEARQKYIGIVAPQTVVKPYEPPSTLVGGMLVATEYPETNSNFQSKKVHVPVAYVPPPPLPPKAELARARNAAAGIGPKATVPTSTTSTKSTSIKSSLK